MNEEEEDWSILGVGIYGAGSVIISDGGQLTVADAVLGGFDLTDIEAEEFYEMWGDPNGSGSVLVTGEGSRLDVDYDLCVGHSGIGNLFVTSGGQVNSHDGYIGDEPNGVGIVAVSGQLSVWHLLDDLYVGGYGTGTMTISNGGLVTVDDDAHIGYGQSSAGTVVVTGEDSVWQVGEDLYVGGNEEGAGGNGSLFVNDGGLVSVWNEMFILETGLVGGDGTITVLQPTTLHNYGTIAPGNDGIGTLTVEGNVVFHPGSTYAVQIANDSSDLLMVDGGVTIEGGTVQVDSVGTILGEREYEIIQATSVTGEFDPNVDTALLDFSFTEIGLDYNDVSVWLYVTAANFNDPNIARTYNQRQVAGALQDIADEGGDDITDDLQQLSTPDDVRHAYDQLSGQTHSRLAPLTVANTSKFLATVTSRAQTVQTGLVSAFGSQGLYTMSGPDASVGDGRMVDVSPQGQTFAVGRDSSTLGDRKWGLWGRGYGLYGDRESENGMPGYSYNVYGGSFGADYQLSDTSLAGIVGGLSEGDVDFAASRDNTDFDAMHIGLYGSLAWTGWYLDCVVTYADLEYDSERFVDLTSERLEGTFDGYELAGYVETGLNWDLAPDLKLQPLASLQYTYLDLDSYTETGGASALTFDGQTFESVEGGLGARLTRRLIESAGDFRADLQLRGHWIHEFGDTRSSVDSSFVSDPTVVFNIRDEEVSRDSAILGVGLTAATSKRTRAYLDFDTRLNSDESVHVISAAFQYRW